MVFVPPRASDEPGVSLLVALGSWPASIVASLLPVKFVH